MRIKLLCCGWNFLGFKNDVWFCYTRVWNGWVGKWKKPVGLEILAEFGWRYTRGIFEKMSAEGTKSWISGQEVVNQKFWQNSLFITTEVYSHWCWKGLEESLDDRLCLPSHHVTLKWGRKSERDKPAWQDEAPCQRPFVDPRKWTWSAFVVLCFSPFSWRAQKTMSIVPLKIWRNHIVILEEPPQLQWGNS